MIYEDGSVRKHLQGLMNLLSGYSTTTMLTSDHVDRFSPESFLARGVIRLHLEELEPGKRVRFITIDKMRATEFDEMVRPLKISKEGITIFSSGSLYR
jgi:KaiC/GvpD/RAD55 family RecA-like ATPase